MSKEKQIEEMAKIIGIPCYKRIEAYGDGSIECPSPLPCNECTAELLYKAGYRKQSEPISCCHEKGGGWISVDERMPEDDLSEEHKKKTIKVLVAIKEKNGITIRTQERFRDYTYSKVGDPITFWTWRFSHGKVTNWMPLPDPPMMKGGAE